MDFYRFNIYLDIVVVSLFAFVANLFVGAIHVSCFIVCCCLHYLSLRFVLFWYLRFSCDYYLSAFFCDLRFYITNNVYRTQLKTENVILALHKHL